MFSFFLSWHMFVSLSAHNTQRRTKQLFEKYANHHKIQGTRRATWIKFHAKNPQIKGATAQNLVVPATWRPGFMHPWTREPHNRWLLKCIHSWQISLQSENSGYWTRRARCVSTRISGVMPWTGTKRFEQNLYRKLNYVQSTFSASLTVFEIIRVLCAEFALKDAMHLSWDRLGMNEMHEWVYFNFLIFVIQPLWW
jgi:hypothetical protein